MRVLPRFGGRRIGSKFVVALAQVPNERMPSDYAAAESFFVTLVVRWSLQARLEARVLDAIEEVLETACRSHRPATRTNS